MGLNAGNELDNELDNENLFTDTEAGEWPELEGEVRMIVAVEDQLFDLEQLAMSIERAGGMNQRFALESERIVPGLLVTDRVPVGFYSKDTSATRLRVSLEEITKGMWALIAAGIAAALALLYKLYKWFSGDKSADGEGGGSGGSSSEAKVEEHERGGDVAAEVKRVMETAGREKTEDGDSLENVAKDLQVRRDTKIYAFLHEQNEAVSEILGDKGLHHTLANLTKQMPKIVAAFAQKYNLLTTMIIEDIRGVRLPNTQKDVHPKSTELTTPVDKRRVMTQLPVAPLSNEIKGSLDEITKGIKDDFDTKIAQPHKIGDNYDTVLRNLARAMADNGLITALKERATWEVEIERFQKDLEHYNDTFIKEPAEGEDNGGEALSIELAQHIRDAITSLLRDSTNITRLHQIIAKASAMMVKLCDDCMPVTESLIKELEERAKSNGHKVPEEVVKLKERLKQMKKEAKK